MQCCRVRLAKTQPGFVHRPVSGLTLASGWRLFASVFALHIIHRNLHSHLRCHSDSPREVAFPALPRKARLHFRPFLVVNTHSRISRDLLEKP
jgi:hypothetical protein